MKKLLLILTLFFFTACKEDYGNQFFAKDALIPVSEAKEDGKSQDSSQPKESEDDIQPKTPVKPEAPETPEEPVIPEEPQDPEPEEPKEPETPKDPGELTPLPLPAPTPEENPEITDVITIEEDKNVSCSPLSEKDNSGAKGIVGNVRVMKSDLKSKSSLRSKLYNYLNPEYSTQLPVKVFMDNIDVPERRFEKGFKTVAQTILSHEDRDLVEWFNVNLESDLMLTAPEEEGHYELMLLSDDGSALSISDSTGEIDKENFLYSPSTHGPKAVCTREKNKSALINFKFGNKYRIRVNYFQGPRYVIALQLYWRKIPDAQVENFKKASLCNSSMYVRSGRDKKLDKDGFKLIAPKFFNLPGSSVNQCNETIIDTFKLSHHPADLSKVKIMIDNIEYTGGFQTFVDTDKDEVSIKLNQGLTQYQKHIVKVTYTYEKEEEEQEITEE